MIASRPMSAVACDACGAERIGPDVDTVPGFHVEVTEVRPGGAWRTASLFLCTRRCAGKNVAEGVWCSPWISGADFYGQGHALPPADQTEEQEEREDGGHDPATEDTDAVRLATGG